MRRLVDVLAVAWLTASAMSPVHASDMPTLKFTWWEEAVMNACLPALVVIPFFLIHLIDRRLSRCDGEDTPWVGRGWLIALLVSLVPWAIVAIWVAFQFASMSA